MRHRTAAFGYNLHEPVDYAVADSTAECLRRCDSLGMRLVDRVVGEVHKRIGRRRRRSRIPAHQNVRCNAATPRCNLYGSIPRPWPSLTTPCPGQLIQCSGPTGLAQPSPAQLPLRRRAKAFPFRRYAAASILLGQRVLTEYPTLCDSAAVETTTVAMSRAVALTLSGRAAAANAALSTVTPAAKAEAAETHFSVAILTRPSRWM